MKINTLTASLPLDNTIVNDKVTSNNKASFMSYLKDALSEVDLLQKEASVSAAQLVLGEEEY